MEGSGSKSTRPLDPLKEYALRRVLSVPLHSLCKLTEIKALSEYLVSKPGARQVRLGESSRNQRKPPTPFAANKLTSEMIRPAHLESPGGSWTTGSYPRYASFELVVESAAENESRLLPWLLPDKEPLTRRPGAIFQNSIDDGAQLLDIN